MKIKMHQLPKQGKESIRLEKISSLINEWHDADNRGDINGREKITLKIEKMA